VESAVNYILIQITLFLWFFQVFIVLLLLTNQVLTGHAGVSPLSNADDSNADSRTLQKIKKKKLRKLCTLLGMGRTNPDPEARTLVFLQVQQIQGSPYPVSSDYMLDYTSSDVLGCHSLVGSGGDGGGLLGSHFGGGSLLGPLLGGGLLGSPQLRPDPETLGDIPVRPERYLRPLYRTLRPLVRFFNK
jgi:hypothetical protein